MGKKVDIDIVREQRDEAYATAQNAAQLVEGLNQRLGEEIRRRDGAMDSTGRFNTMLAKMDPTGPEANAVKEAEKAQGKVPAKKKVASKKKVAAKKKKPGENK